MKVHPRTQIVNMARLDIDTAITDALHEHSLTYAELFGILAEEMRQWAMYAVRDEREERS